MSLSRLLLGLSAAVAAGGAAWVVFRDQEGEPVAPIPLPEVPSGGSGIAATADEIEALGRVIASEAGSGTEAEQRCIAWTVRNHFRGKSIYQKQFPWRSQKGGDPPFSSARPATAATLRLATEVLAQDQADDPTGGATSFFEPRMQDAFYKAGELARAGQTGDRVIDGVKITDISRFKAYRKDADGIRKSWGRGSTLYKTEGRFEFWGSARRLAQRGNPPQAVAAGWLADLALLDAEVYS